VAEAEGLRIQHDLIDMTICVASVLLDLDIYDVQEACASYPCEGGLCTATTQPPKPLHQPSSDVFVDLGSPVGKVSCEQRRWSLCCSNTSKECRRQVAYLQFSNKHYTVAPLRGLSVTEQEEDGCGGNPGDIKEPRLANGSLQRALYIGRKELVRSEHMVNSHTISISGSIRCVSQ
jgi:hypothetical protein